METEHDEGDAGNHRLGAAQDHRPLTATELLAPNEAERRVAGHLRRRPRHRRSRPIDRLWNTVRSDTDGSPHSEHCVDDLRGACAPDLLEVIEVVHRAGNVPQRIEEEEDGGDLRLLHRGCDDACRPDHLEGGADEVEVAQRTCGIE